MKEISISKKIKVIRLSLNWKLLVSHPLLKHLPLIIPSCSFPEGQVFCLCGVGLAVTIFLV